MSTPTRFCLKDSPRLQDERSEQGDRTLRATPKAFSASVRSFNLQYFDGRLPHYEICVLYDPSFWDDRPGVGFYEFSFGDIDTKENQIRLFLEWAPREGA